jgi:two-component system, LytTR family, response regulator LytT
MKIGVCDDNQLYLNQLVSTLQSYISPSKDIIIEALTPEQLETSISNRCFSYDILISDIDMGNYNGIDFASKINDMSPNCIIIFISNYLNYATEVYDVAHIYFVLKSEAKERLPKALSKALALHNERVAKSILIRYQNTEYRIFLSEITHIEALGRYLYIHDTKGTYKCIQSLKSIMNELSSSFARCHNSYLVNMQYIHSINRSNCVLKNGITIPISQTYSRDFQAAYIAYVSRELL